VHHYNSTQYCNTNTVFIYIPLPPDQHHISDEAKWKQGGCSGIAKHERRWQKLRQETQKTQKLTLSQKPTFIGKNCSYGCVCVCISLRIFAMCCTQSDQSPDNANFPDNSPTVRGTRLVECYSYHARTSVTVSCGGRNARVNDPKPYI